MTESIIVEAVRNIGANQASMTDAARVQNVASPESVERFEAAMAPSATPFVSEISSAWNSAQANHQALLHRISALGDMNRRQGAASLNLVELQYDVMNLAFKQEVVTKIADKSSNAIQTLIKNQ